MNLYHKVFELAQKYNKELRVDKEPGLSSFNHIVVVGEKL